jgi:rubredoxin
MKKYVCEICGWIYDPEEGVPEQDIEPGTRWADVPDDFTCPDCGASKEDFSPYEEEEEEEEDQ